MENSRNSMCRSLSAVSPYELGAADINDQFPEESSWTMYLEDFSNTNNYNSIIDDVNDKNSSFFSDINYQTSSLVSDAASYSAFRRNVVGSNCSKSYNRSLSFTKRKTKAPADLQVDDDLEDTASCPANSPKVCNLMSHFENNLKQKHAVNISQEIRGSGSGSGQIDERNNDELGFINGRSENHGSSTELKNKGLCLVPLSMVVQYLG